MTLTTDDMKTEWYPPEVKPARVGAYELAWYPASTPPRVIKGTVFWWTGDEWRFVWSGGAKLAQQSRYWRGLKAPHDGETS